jgi:hypothetical protein
MKSTTTAATLFGIASVLVATSQPSDARVSAAPVGAAQLYPYCQVSSASGGMNCYLASPSQCEYRELCVRNPAYLGDATARAWKQKNKPEWRWW